LANFTSSSGVSSNGTGNISRVNFSYTVGSPISSSTWSPATGLSSTSNLSTTANPSTNTQYTLNVTDANGCQAQDVVDVTVNALPTINATPAARCDDGSVSLGAAPSSGTTVNWYTSATSTNSVGTGALFSTPSLSSTTTYYAAATSPEGCITSPRESVTATINALPNAFGGPDKTGVTQCGLEAITMNAQNPSSGISGQWSHISGPNVLFADPTVHNTTVTPQTYGSTSLVRWTTTSGAGCNGTDDVEVQFTQPSTGPLSSINPQAGDLVWGGMTNSAWSTSANWYEYQAGGYWKRMSSGEPSSTDNVYIVPNSTGGMCVSSNYNATPASSENVYDIRIMSGATLNLNNGSVNVFGNIVNDGTVNPGSAIVKMMGTSNQTISGTGTSTFNKLTIENNGGNVIISQPVTVENTLKMTAGDIDNSQVLTLGTTGNTGTLSYSSGHILGKFKRHFDSDETAEMLFPVAKGGIVREGKVKFNQGPGPDQHLSMEVILGAPSQSQMTNNYNGLPFYASDQQLIQVYSNQAFLEIIPTSNNYSSAIMSQPYTFSMHADNMSGVVNNQTVRLIKCAGHTNPNQHHTTWAPCGTHATVTGSNNDFWAKSTGVTGFSFFGFGSNNDNPLPVELVSFNGNCGDGVVELNWTTASEHNSAYYQLEKSRDGENWDVINTQDAAGISNEMRSYSFVDAHASSGNNLYRLSQFDIDGASKTYSVVNVNCAAANVGYFSTHPNPSTGEFHVVLNNEELIGTATIRMVDSRGTIVSQKEIEVMEGINVYNFNEFKVAPGMYYITVVNDDKSTETIKQSIK
jgi:beta-galactosidase beta subunit